MKIQLVTDTLIETYNPLVPGYGFRVLKVPKGDGKYAFELLAVYNNTGKMFNYCGIEPDDLRVVFNYFLNTGEYLEVTEAKRKHPYGTNYPTEPLFGK